VKSAWGLFFPLSPNAYFIPSWPAHRSEPTHAPIVLNIAKLPELLKMRQH
jgi:hypothetical protein